MSQNKVALITGASGGLGSATARALAEQGYDLVLMSRSGCAEIAEETGGVGVAGSVLSDTDMKRAVQPRLEQLCPNRARWAVSRNWQQHCVSAIGCRWVYHRAMSDRRWRREPPAWFVAC